MICCNILYSKTRNSLDSHILRCVTNGKPNRFSNLGTEPKPENYIIQQRFIISLGP